MYTCLKYFNTLKVKFILFLIFFKNTYYLNILFYPIFLSCCTFDEIKLQFLVFSSCISFFNMAI